MDKHAVTAIPVEHPGGRLRSAWRRLVQRLSARPDTEHEQALLRIVLGIAAFLYLYVQSDLVIDPNRPEGVALYVVAAFIGFAVIMLVAAFVHTGISTFRRMLGLCTDLGVTTYCMHLTGGVTPLQWTV